MSSDPIPVEQKKSSEPIPVENQSMATIAGSIVEAVANQVTEGIGDVTDESVEQSNKKDRSGKVTQQKKWAKKKLKKKTQKVARKITRNKK